MIWLLSTFLALAIFDGYYTNRMLRKYGPVIEMNALIRYLASKTNLLLAITLGIGLPTLGLAVLGFHYHPVLWGATALRLPLAALQVRHLVNGKRTAGLAG
jgi:hypothetical protein